MQKLIHTRGISLSGAMFTAVLSVLTEAGAPAKTSIFTLAVFSNLMGGLTHYGFGSALAYYESKYVTLRVWWSAGFVCSILNVSVFLFVGPLWWKTIGFA
jgi:di/tricarboxylate transporter